MHRRSLSKPRQNRKGQLQAAPRWRAFFCARAMVLKGSRNYPELSEIIMEINDLREFSWLHFFYFHFG
jgi:hypothetical protein